MSSNISQWTGTARLVADAEMNTTPSGKQVLKMRLAVNTGFGDSKSTLWLNGAMWGARGDKLAQYMTKGKLIALTGELSSREYTDKNNVPRLSIELNVQNVELLSGGEKTQEQASPDVGDGEVIPF